MPFDSTMPSIKYDYINNIQLAPLHPLILFEYIHKQDLLRVFFYFNIFMPPIKYIKFNLREIKKVPTEAKLNPNIL